MINPKVNELQTVVESLGMKFVFANINEANLGLDQIERELFPVFLLITSESERTTTTVTESGLLIKTDPMIAMILQMNDDVDVSSSDVDDLIYSCHQLADRVIAKINKLDITDPNQNVVEYDVSKLYATFDHHLCGIGMTFNWSTKSTVRC